MEEFSNILQRQAKHAAESWQRATASAMSQINVVPKST